MVPAGRRSYRGLKTAAESDDGNEQEAILLMKDRLDLHLLDLFRQEREKRG